MGALRRQWQGRKRNRSNKSSSGRTTQSRLQSNACSNCGTTITIDKIRERVQCDRKFMRGGNGTSKESERSSGEVHLAGVVGKVSQIFNRRSIGNPCGGGENLEIWGKWVLADDPKRKLWPKCFHEITSGSHRSLSLCLGKGLALRSIFRFCIN